MDLGIKGKSAIVCAASKGLGRACAWSLAREGVRLTICARGEEALTRTADEIGKQFGVPVNAVVADITTPEGRAKVLAACPQPDILVSREKKRPLPELVHGVVLAQRTVVEVRVVDEIVRDVGQTERTRERHRLGCGGVDRGRAHALRTSPDTRHRRSGSSAP